MSEIESRDPRIPDSDTWEDRLINEGHELHIRIQQLAQFIHGETFKDLEEKERNLIHDQFAHMGNYLRILRKRIEGLKVKPVETEQEIYNPDTGKNEIVNGEENA